MNQPATTARLILTLLAVTGAVGAQQPTAPPGDVEARLRRLDETVQILQQARSEDRQRIQTLERELEQTRTQRERAAARMGDLERQLADRNDARLEELVARVQETLPQTPIVEDAPSVFWSGYFDIEFREDKAGDKNTEFDQHRLILQFHADIAERIALDSEIEIEGGGAGAGFLTDSEIVVEYAELQFELFEWLNLQAGALLVPFGKYNLLHDSPIQDLTDRPLVDRRIVPTTWTDAGVGLYGAVHVADWLTLDYDVMLGNGLTDGLSSSGGTRGARPSFREDNNDDKMVMGRLGATVDVPFLDAVNLGFSIAHGKYDDDDDHDLTMLGFDWTLKKGPFELVGEYAKLNISRGAAEIAAGIPPGMEGWYAELRFHFFPDSWRGTFPLFTDQSTFTLIARYGEADTDESGTGVDFPARGDRYRDDRRRLTVGFNFRPVEKTVIKFEYQWFFEPSRIPDVDNNRLVVSIATYF